MSSCRRMLRRASSSQARGKFHTGINQDTRMPPDGFPRLAASADAPMAHEQCQSTAACKASWQVAAEVVPPGSRRARLAPMLAGASLPPPLRAPGSPPLPGSPQSTHLASQCAWPAPRKHRDKMSAQFLAGQTLHNTSSTSGDASASSAEAPSPDTR
eukprot:CAMPEP_0178380488 /NCGR_PEP_ID=MMETSP0689_2-20121128/5487_1 /TAXON_ID=160604 /ORGANISM="Amphidinium massartii, Strain CS-259" /LENGTH=156 /DNA_ID=CAMNT_0020000629 /DNA_START=987 /DNA_END=1458 /DNA_ORIENTATION=+